MPKRFAQILLPLSLNQNFSYFSQDIEIEVGDVVKVEFGKKEIFGVVFSVSSEAPDGFDEKKIKPILEKHQFIKLNKNHLKFIEQLASYNLASKGLVLRAFIGILNSNKTKKTPKPLIQEINPQKFSLKKLLTSQQEVFEKIQNCQEPLVSLIDGITGSGKTEIYFALIAKILTENKDAQILILLPEIALTSQIILRFEKQFGFKPALWHSKIGKKEKTEIFYGINSGETKVIVGARSALLLPFKNLQIVVIDEEHDNSFKQEDVFNFHARDMAILKSKLEGFKIILNSATPAIETYNNAILGRYNHFILEQKFGTKNEVSLVDLRQEKLPKDNFLSKKLEIEIAKNLKNSELTLLFLNRRGYSPVSICSKCQHKISCNNCDFHLVFHKSKNQLVCHHCGYHCKANLKCSSCGEEDSLISLGVGVEKLEEEVRLKFPNARIALATSDNLQNFEDANRLLAQILNHEIDIIIGTQMIAKGYDFANLTLVGVVDLDSMLYSSEIRALEKSYQILTQVIGRAGRDKLAGRVLIQTYNPDNFLFQQILNGTKKDFYNFEINNRQMLDFPPFSRMVKFEISSFLEKNAKQFAKEIVKNFPISENIEIFGPAPAPLQRLKNRHHFLVNLKASKKINVQKLVLDVMANMKIPSSIRVRIDVDVL